MLPQEKVLGFTKLGPAVETCPTDIIFARLWNVRRLLQLSETTCCSSALRLRLVPSRMDPAVLLFTEVLSTVMLNGPQLKLRAIRRPYQCGLLSRKLRIVW